MYSSSQVQAYMLEAGSWTLTCCRKVHVSALADLLLWKPLKLLIDPLRFNIIGVVGGG